MSALNNTIKTLLLLALILIQTACGSSGGGGGLTVNGPGVSGNLDSDTNVYDMYGVYLEAGVAYTITNSGTSTTSLYSYDPIQYQADNPGMYALPIDIGSPIDFTPSTSGTYYIFLATLSTATYELTVTSP